MVALPVALMVCAGFAGCGESDTSTASSLETQVAETVAAQDGQCEMLATGEDCLARFLLCLGDADPRSEEGAACRASVQDCLPVRPPGGDGHVAGDGDRPPPPEGVRPPHDGAPMDGGVCDGGPMGPPPGAPPPQAGGEAGGHPPGLPPPEALASCRDAAVSCLSTDSDESECLDPLRSCLRGALSDAFQAMCADRVAACDGSTDPRCTELVARCNSGGPAACSSAS
jgi:hypothetical protein